MISKMSKGQPSGNKRGIECPITKLQKLEKKSLKLFGQKIWKSQTLKYVVNNSHNNYPNHKSQNYNQSQKPIGLLHRP